MASRAGLVPLGRRLLLATMTVATRRGLRSGMRFVAARAQRVTRLDQACLSLVAARAGLFLGLRPMRQPVVTTATRLVPLICRDLLDTRGMTRLTRRHVAQSEFERVRLVAAGASGCAMHRAIGRGELVTRAAGLDLHRFGDLGRMRIMAAHAVAGLPGMIGVNVLVASRTSRRGCGSNVVRGVAVRTAVMGRDATAADHVDLRVAVTTRRGCFFLERVWLVTTGARLVSGRKHGRCRDDRLLFRVTRLARRECVLGRCMAMLVTGRACFSQRFTLRGVAGRDLLVTIGAGCGLRRSFVRLVTAETGLGPVHHHGGELALLRAVTALAVGGLVALHCQRSLAQAGIERAPVDGHARGRGLQRFFTARALERERVAGRADGFGSLAEALGSFRRRVLDVSLFLVARDATIRRHWTHFVGGRRMALRALDLFLHHVNAMTGHVAREVPGRIDVHASAPLPAVRGSFLRLLRGRFVRVLRGVFLVRAGGERRKHEYWDQHPCKQ